MDENKVLSNYELYGKAENLMPYGEGHINTTYKFNVGKKEYILQRINDKLFDTPLLMKNIVSVCEYAKKQNSDILLPTVVYAKNGESYVKVDGDGYYRIYNFVEDSMSYQVMDSVPLCYLTAKTFARFADLLSGFDASTLTEIIPNFHNTVDRFKKFEKALKEDKKGRAKYVQDEINFVLSREKYCSRVLDLIKSGEIPLRVTHNDTKLNNLLFSSNGEKVLAVIDLDTIMPGSALYDFGDMVRFGTNSANEDEVDLSKVYFKEEYFESFAKGYIDGLNGKLTEAEIENLAFSGILMTYECGMRFLTDYLEGDTYFKIHRENHNLDRCRTQFKLVSDMEKVLDKTTAFAVNYAKNK